MPNAINQQPVGGRPGSVPSEQPEPSVALASPTTPSWLGTLLGDKPCCCVSDPESKAPMAVRKLRKRSLGYASPLRPGDYATLAEVASLDLGWLEERDSRWRNVCVRLDDTLGFAVLDVEPTADEEVKNLAACCDEAIATEVSLSGSGLHVAIPTDVVTRLELEWPNAAGKSVWKSQDGTYELLIRHHNVTMTGIGAGRPGAASSILPLLNELAATQGRSVKRGSVGAMDASEVEGSDAISELAQREMADFTAPLSAYGNDASRRDCAVATRAAGTLRRMHTDLSESELVALTSECARTWLESEGSPREKWDEVHSSDGLTYGELTAAKAVAYTDEPCVRPWRYDSAKHDDDEYGAVSALIALASAGCAGDALDEAVPMVERLFGVSLADDMLAAARRVVPVQAPAHLPPIKLVRRTRRMIAGIGLPDDEVEALVLATAREIDSEAGDRDAD